MDKIQATTASIRWQTEMAAAFSDLNELLVWLQLDQFTSQDPILSASLAASADFPMRVPKDYANRMEKGNPRDPLLLQVLPTTAELDLTPGFVNDPVGDQAAEQDHGLLRKYAGRALLITTGACAIHCRYCFRRNYPYQDSHISSSDPKSTISYIKKNTDINEVILSGGDPLSLSDRKLAPLMKQLDNIPHIHRLRLHTRTPVVLPNRIDQPFINWISHIKTPVAMVIHCNHPNELSDSVVAKLKTVRDCGVQLLNQAVLLHGVNDNALTLTKLSEQLFSAGVLPYYLHMLDPVRGAAHFDVTEVVALEIMAQLQQNLSGYLVPKLVREVIGANSKIAVSKNSVLLSS
ncbi:Lysine 2,3-aminomutase [hydrothermal vent metagenome]|uniref:L-lysine 2,3-aminomutase n=1 Tax=hydrothermal vent metagenome TaxID=652676 RepID=A0A3B0Z3V3_9ZZZZ